jgi:hypothetical protein
MAALVAGFRAPELKGHLIALFQVQMLALNFFI